MKRSPCPPGRWASRRNASTRCCELVGLDETAAGRRVGKYSLGMRQRLGLAHALLGDPEVLILDEPANGLDPEGMRWMRGLLRDFADRGGTVLLSSHLLAEVEAVADRMIIIGDGRIQAQGTRAELLPQTGTIVEADNVDGLDAALHRAGLAMHSPTGTGAWSRPSRRCRPPGDGGRHRPAPDRPGRGRGPRTPLLRADRTGGPASTRHPELAGAPHEHHDPRPHRCA